MVCVLGNLPEHKCMRGELDRWWIRVLRSHQRMLHKRAAAVTHLESRGRDRVGWPLVGGLMSSRHRALHDPRQLRSWRSCLLSCGKTLSHCPSWLIPSRPIRLPDTSTPTRKLVVIRRHQIVPRLDQAPTSMFHSQLRPRLSLPGLRLCNAPPLGCVGVAHPTRCLLFCRPSRCAAPTNEPPR